MSASWKFRKELEALLNRHSMENGSNTPDFVLAVFVQASLDAFDLTVRAREDWYGRGEKATGGGGDAPSETN